ncbi:MAG: ABC transporter ATP-binding protein [Acidobacteria bacterium]|nr:ABC transporter ATP-binding protein [Acidobacteriota bacterium]
MIVVEGLTKRFGKVTAVDGLSFQVQPGEIVGLLGPNGAGKTTAMRCMCGITPAQEGRVLIQGVDLDDDPVRAKSKLAFVPSEPRLFDYLTVQEHIGFFARLYAAADGQASREWIAEREAAGAALLAELDLAQRLDFLPGALSRGMKQKLMIACALVHEPQVLIFDEPFTGLDPHAIRKVRQIIQNHIGKGACVMISSHLLGMVEDMITSALIINRGRKVVEGNMDELRKNLSAEHQHADLEEIFIQLTSEAPQIERVAP